MCIFEPSLPQTTRRNSIWRIAAAESGGLLPTLDWIEQIPFSNFYFCNQILLEQSLGPICAPSALMLPAKSEPETNFCVTFVPRHLAISVGQYFVVSAHWFAVHIWAITFALSRLDHFGTFRPTTALTTRRNWIWRVLAQFGGMQIGSGWSLLPNLVHFGLNLVRFWLLFNFYFCDKYRSVFKAIPRTHLCLSALVLLPLWISSAEGLHHSLQRFVLRKPVTIFFLRQNLIQKPFCENIFQFLPMKWELGLVQFLRIVPLLLQLCVWSFVPRFGL